jgi:hypothetical protein
VLVVPDGKYHKIDDWAPLGEAPPALPETQREPSPDSIPSGDDIPF